MGSTGSAIVVDRRDRFTGLVTIATIMDAIASSQSAAREDSATPAGTNTGEFAAVPDSTGAAQPVDELRVVEGAGVESRASTHADDDAASGASAFDPARDAPHGREPEGRS